MANKWNYKEIYDPLNPSARTNGCILEHRRIASELLGRQLKKFEVVHHIDNNRLNNSKENIIVFKSQSDHIRYHKTGKLIQVKDGSYMSPLDKTLVKCNKCGKPCSYKSELCNECRKYEKSKYLPKKEVLKKLVWEKPTTHIAKDFGVSGKAVEKWCKKYNIDKPPRGYWQKIKF